MSVSFNNSYARLPDRFFSRQPPVPVSKPELIRVNEPLADLLGIDPEWLASEDGAAMVAGNRLPPGAEPIATVYAGHQFGGFSPVLGDGRAVLLGEVIGRDGERYDIQLKGSGQTPYSRMGDGRAPLGPVLREYIVSEAMAALGIPTSRALAAVTTGDPVYREEALPGAVLARVARSHIRIGTVQYFAARSDMEAMRLLVDHVIARHYPEDLHADNKPLALLDRVMRAQAKLVARWQAVGFIHGVMNTDNMLLSGETIDYGPCAFMDAFNPKAVFSAIDHGGRYAFRNQPGIAHWNLACLAQALAPLLADREEKAVALAGEALDRFPACFLDEHLAGLRSKLGLVTAGEEDEQLAADFLDLLEAHRLDFTLSFRRLSELAGAEPADLAGDPAGLPPALDGWLSRWRRRCAGEAHPDRRAFMLQTNPALIPRNHLVEEVIRAATVAGDFQPFHELVDALADPFSTAVAPVYLAPPRPEQLVKQTFCGT